MPTTLPFGEDIAEGDAQQLRLNPVTLSFPEPQDESAYRLWFFDHNERFMHVVWPVLLGTYTLVGVLERVTLPDRWQVLWAWRYGVLVPCLAAAYAIFRVPALCKRFGRPWSQEVTLVATAIGLFALAMMGYEMVRDRQPELIMYSGLAYMVSILFLYAALQLRFVYASILGTATLLLGAHVVAGHASDPFIQQSIIGAATVGNVIGMFGAYILERSNRRRWFTSRLVERQQRRVDHLLGAILPRAIAQQLYGHAGSLATDHRDVTVLFADIVGFTPLSARLAPADLVELLDDLFSQFDDAATRHEVEKIKTIGDAWMGACGVPNPCDGHAARTASLALDMQRIVKDVALTRRVDISLRVGIHSGPLAAGVIGRRKSLYDLWGDTVNVAAQMESNGAAGRVLVSEATACRLPPALECVERGAVRLKSRGYMRCFWLRVPEVGS